MHRNERGVIDESFVRRYFDGVFKAYYQDWKDFIKIRRRDYPNLFCEYTDFCRIKKIVYFSIYNTKKTMKKRNWKILKNLHKVLKIGTLCPYFLPA